MSKVDKLIRYHQGLFSDDIRLRLGIEENGGSSQYIVGTDDNGVILWAPLHLVDMIGTNVEDLDALMEIL